MLDAGETRRAADEASAALREALMLAGAPPELLGEPESVALFALLEQIERQSLSVAHALDQLKGDFRHGDAAARRRVREDMIVLRTRLRRLHVAASLAETLARAGAAVARTRIEALQGRLAQAGSAASVSEDAERVAH